MIWLAGLAVVYAALAAMVVTGLLRGWRKPMPSPPPPYRRGGLATGAEFAESMRNAERTREWLTDPSRFARCPGCGTLRPIVGGLIGDHDRPEPQVPFNVQSFPCQGAGQQPAQTRTGSDL